MNSIISMTFESGTILHRFPLFICSTFVKCLSLLCSKFYIHSHITKYPDECMALKCACVGGCTMAETIWHWMICSSVYLNTLRIDFSLTSTTIYRLNLISARMLSNLNKTHEFKVLPTKITLHYYSTAIRYRWLFRDALEQFSIHLSK